VKTKCCDKNNYNRQCFGASFEYFTAIHFHPSLMFVAGGAPREASTYP
jgi:hypothetical protein